MQSPEPDGANMRRRDFIGALGSAGLYIPFVARAQHARKVPKIGVLMAGRGELDRERTGRIAAFRRALLELG